MFPFHKNKKLKKSFLKIENWIIFCSAIVIAKLIFFLCGKSHYGLDLTDESFYLNWISNPWIYSSSITQFGYVYNLFFHYLPKHIIPLRQANILITFTLSWFLCFSLLNGQLIQNKNCPGLKSILLAAIYASPCLLFFSVWIPTPSYNSLAFQSLLLAGIAMILLNPPSIKYNYISAILIGISGWLAFMAKPSTALGLGGIIIFYIFVLQKSAIRLIISMGLTFTLFLIGSALYIDGSIQQFCNRLILGVELGKILENGLSFTNMFRWDPLTISLTNKFTCFLSLCFISLIIYLCNSSNKIKQRVGFIFLIILSFYNILILQELNIITAYISKTQGFLVYSIPIASILTLIINILKKDNYNFNSLILSLCFMVFPYIYALGTNNNYWLTGVNVSIFYIISVVILHPSTKNLGKNLNSILPLAIITQTTTICLLYKAMESPYRQYQSLKMNNVKVTIHDSLDKIILSNELVTYVNQLKITANAAGFKKGSPMLDLTGHYPGAMYILGAKPIGQPWLLGGYRGSANYLLASLDQNSCSEIGHMWILTEPKGPFSHSETLLKKYGINLKNDYVQVGKFLSPMGALSQKYEQILYKPSRSFNESLMTCNINKRN
ncbi:MAG: hypothetical protein JWM09_1325 [Francisellaceae bacterium]|nr:hypothetical protein [Francisellaceae bacterium]